MPHKSDMQVTHSKSLGLFLIMRSGLKAVIHTKCSHSWKLHVLSGMLTQYQKISKPNNVSLLLLVNQNDSWDGKHGLKVWTSVVGSLQPAGKHHTAAYSVPSATVGWGQNRKSKSKNLPKLPTLFVQFRSSVQVVSPPSFVSNPGVLIRGSEWEKEKALKLHKNCSTIAKTLVFYRHCFSHISKTQHSRSYEKI